MLKVLRCYFAKKVFFSGVECKRLRFYQFNLGNRFFFKQLLDRWDVRISDLPHYDCASRMCGGDIVCASELYLSYLQASWGGRGDFDQKVESFRAHISFFNSNGPAKVPLITSLPGVEGLMIVDGNHRFSIAAALNKGLVASYMPYRYILEYYSPLRRFYKGKKLRQISRLGAFCSDPGWSGEFASFFRLFASLCLHGKRLLDFSGTPFLAEALYYREGLVSAISFFDDSKLASLSLRSIIPREKHSSLQVFLVDSLQAELPISTDIVVCRDDNFAAFEGVLHTSCVLGGYLVVLGGKVLTRSWLKLIDYRETAFFGRVYVYSKV